MKNEFKKKPFITNRQQYIESIYHIIYYGNAAAHYDEILKRLKDKIPFYEMSGIRLSFHSNLLVNIVSLNDELENYLFKYKSQDKKVNEKIKSYRFIVDPILKDFKKWRDLRSFRNNVLAHNFRINRDNFKSVHLSKGISSYDIPDSQFDLVIIFKYFSILSKVCEEIFSDEYKEAKNIADSVLAPTKKQQLITNEIDNYNSIIEEVNKRITNYNIS